MIKIVSAPYRANRTQQLKKKSIYLNKKSQSMLDYVILFTVIIAVLLLMGYYIRNSLSGKFREGADVFGRGEVYLPSVAGVGNPSDVNRSVTNK